MFYTTILSRKEERGLAIMIIGVTCSCLPQSLSQKAVVAFLRGAEESGHRTSLVPIGKGLSGCTGCHACKKRNSFCVQQDSLRPYFVALSDAEAVVFGAGIYMGYPQGEAWSFMNRHFCLHDKVGEGAHCRIEPGKKLYPIFAQGAPDNPGYRANYEALLTPFDDWGFKRMPVLVVTSSNSEAAIQKAYEMGRAI